MNSDMDNRWAKLSTVDEIRERFDQDVERFSTLKTGHQAMPDSPECMRLVARTAAMVRPTASSLLDVGCGAGNYTLALLQVMNHRNDAPSNMDCTLLDLSQPMLDRAQDRVMRKTTGVVDTMQADIRDAKLSENHYDIIMAAAVLHHLRDEAEWRMVYTKLLASLKPGGWLFVVDMVEQNDTALQTSAWEQYGEYLTGLRDETYRDEVFAYIAKEDSPRPLLWQLELMQQVGFVGIDVLHKRLVAACYCGKRHE